MKYCLYRRTAYKQMPTEQIEHSTRIQARQLGLAKTIFSLTPNQIWDSLERKVESKGTDLEPNEKLQILDLEYGTITQRTVQDSAQTKSTE
jgi:hypothetical protein